VEYQPPGKSGLRFDTADVYSAGRSEEIVGAAPKGWRWWQGAVLYQVYVRSWLDTDSDGYGDLPGVLAGLDYLSWLGVAGVWLSPTMPSPDDDWGYDVSDYMGVHPELGTLADLDRLIAGARARGLRVLLDLVPNHSSSAHPWFIEAAASRSAEHRDYYVWADPAPGGGPPNNWVDTTGSSAWEWHEPTCQYYLHNFLDSQPDINWWNPEVHREFEAILRFWFDRGVDGFRIDVAHGLYKDALLRDNPPADTEGQLSGRYGFRAEYNFNRPQTHEVYRRWRTISDGHAEPRLLLGETWVGSLDRLAEFYGADDELHLAFNFPFMFSDFAASSLAGIVAETLAKLPERACPVWTASNHDIGRFATRWCQGDERKVRLALIILATLPGTLVLYYGDEIAMTDVDVPLDLRRDRATLLGDQRRGNRDRARTPMLWDSSPSAGFTAEGARPWLPIGGGLLGSVASQRADPSSVLNYCRRLLALRRIGQGAGEVAAYREIAVSAGQWVYRFGSLAVAANFADTPAACPALAEGRILISSDRARAIGSAPRELGPWEGVLFQPSAAAG
jgi:alpha-glucosidase